MQRIVLTLEQSQTADDRRTIRATLAREFEVALNTIDWVQATRTRAKRAQLDWPFRHGED